MKARLVSIMARLVSIMTFAAGGTLARWQDSNWFYAVLTGIFALVIAVVSAYCTARFNAKFKTESEGSEK
jgi:putative Mn2+ efflux pump MntP